MQWKNIHPRVERYKTMKKKYEKGVKEIMKKNDSLG